MRTAAERKAEAARAQQITEELVQERKDWVLRVYKRDLRCKAGERQVNEYRYNDWTQAQMAEETRDLRNTLYRAEQGWRLEFHASWVKVRNIMTGQDVQIRAEDQGGVCDPSQERFWTM
jgi:type I restriction-modification system DNA methylase subunit